MNILVTGGVGYIGSHTCIELLNAGHEVVIIDNFSNSKPESLKRIEEITKKDFKFYETDIINRVDLEKVFSENKIDLVIHFAGLKAVGESVTVPLFYYHNNITGTIILCEVMQRYNVKKIVFSSSATVYGDLTIPPVTEDAPTSVLNPYGRTKLMIEEILQDLSNSDPEWSIAMLRYFNPIGAHKSGIIGEKPNGIPNNIMPYITQVASGIREHLSIFGDDYATHDGTGIRDYTHVMDLANGHLIALNYLNNHLGAHIFNLGTGKGYSVLDLVQTFEEVNDIKIPYKIMGRRPGDIAISYADVSKAEKELGWKAERGLREMCEDAWRWEKNSGK